MAEPRTILCTGKGGVGKTSVAAATAMRAAAAGRRVIVISTDPAHSLSTALGRPVGPEPVPVAPRLWAQEVSAQREMERSWQSMRDWLSRILARQGVDAIRAEELTVPPGMDELFSLLEIHRHHRSGEYEVIVVDCAPTGETLRLLGFPEVAEWWIERVFPFNRRIAGAARPLARTLDLPVPDLAALDDLERLAAKLIEINRILRDPERSSIRLVLNPDRMVISEAERTYTYLSLYGFQTDAVIANRVLPAELDGGYFDGWRRAQAGNLVRIEEGFAPVPVLTARWLDREVIGPEMLTELGGEIFGELERAGGGADAGTGAGADSDSDAGAGDLAADSVLHRGAGREFTATDGGALIRVPVPFADREEIGVRQIGDELIVTIGEERRNMILPAALRGSEPSGAAVDGGVLEIRFEKEADVATAG